MNDDNLSVILRFESSITQDGLLELNTERFKQLREKGFDKVEVIILGASETAVVNKGFDVELYKNIRNMQTLPDSVVLDFLQCKGSLRKTNIKDRIEF